jgi:hypothetical protein
MKFLHHLLALGSEGQVNFDIFPFSREPEARLTIFTKATASNTYSKIGYIFHAIDTFIPKRLEELEVEIMTLLKVFDVE